jgi:hypothetical protein
VTIKDSIRNAMGFKAVGITKNTICMGLLSVKGSFLFCVLNESTPGVAGVITAKDISGQNAYYATDQPVVEHRLAQVVWQKNSQKFRG